MTTRDTNVAFLPSVRSNSGAGKAVQASTTRAVAAVAMLAVSPATLALAQSSSGSSELPAIVVEGQKAKPKKKPVAAKKSSAPKQVKQAEPVPQAPVDDAAVATGDGAARPGGNPYANPDAPYNVQRSASGKITEPLLNTPKTITVLPKEVLQDKKALDLKEIARQTPGLSITSGENGASFGSNINIRGFNARNDIFVDGIREPGNIGRDVFSMEQLEIYKGPSGTISGRATPGGALNFISKQPDFTGNYYEVETTVGTDETFRTTIDANQTISRDFAVRGNILYNQNEVAGRDFVEDERWGGLLSAAVRPTDDVKINLDYYRVRRDGRPDNGVPVSRTARVPLTELGVDRDNWYGQLNFDSVEEESDVGTAKIEWKINEVATLTNITRYGQNFQDYKSVAPRPANAAQSVPGGVVDITRTPSRIQDTELFVNQTNLNLRFNTGSWRHNVIAGVEYSLEQMDRDAYTFGNTVGEPTTTPIANPNPNRNTKFIQSIGPQFDADVETVAYYVGDTIHLTDQWIVSGNVRIDDFSRDQVGGTAANTAKVDETLVSWNTGIVFKPIPSASFYAAYGVTESPIGNELDSTGIEYNGLTAANAHLSPEETRGVELGTKWELFNGRMLATAAVFETVKDNARTNRNVLPLDGGNESDGKYRVRGVEFGVSGNITDRWSVFGGVTWLETETLKSDLPSEVGRRLANIPVTQFALLSKYKLTDQLTIGGQAIYAGEVVAGHFAEHDLGYRIPDYWRFDAMAEYEFNDNWSIEVSGLNLTDELYYDAIYQDAASFAYVAPGRAGYLSVKWKY